MTICPNCGSDAEDDAVFCEQCGFKIDDRKVSSSDKQNTNQEKKKIKFIKRK